MGAVLFEEHAEAVSAAGVVVLETGHDVGHVFGQAVKRPPQPPQRVGVVVGYGRVEQRAVVDPAFGVDPALGVEFVEYRAEVQRVAGLLLVGPAVAFLADDRFAGGREDADGVDGQHVGGQFDLVAGYQVGGEFGGVARVHRGIGQEAELDVDDVVVVFEIVADVPSRALRARGQVQGW